MGCAQPGRNAKHAAVRLRAAREWRRHGLGGSWDAYHINAIQALPNNQLLVSMRNTWAAYLIDATTDTVALDARRQVVELQPARSARFAWQHDVRLLPERRGDAVRRQLLPDRGFREICPAQRVRPRPGAEAQQGRSHRIAGGRYSHSPKLVVSFLGSTQLLPNGNALVGWGNQPYFSEYSKSGRQLLDAQLPGKDLTYRALFTSNWAAVPFYPPSGAVRTSGGATTVYASWNGATGVARWQVLGGSSASHLERVASSPRTGFETAIPLGRRRFKVLAVRAIDGRGRTIGSNVIKGGRRGGSGLPKSY